jgi:hypothetical protein
MLSAVSAALMRTADSRGAERRAEAAAFAARPIQAFEVVFDVADCVSFPPVAVIEERPLSGPE